MPRAEKISTLWIVVMFNMGFADILSFMFPDLLAQILTGTVDGVTITPMFLLLAAVFVELAIVMIYLTKALAPRISRKLNIAAAALTILFVIGGGSLTPHYIFFASIEVIALIYIGELAWRWPAMEKR